MAPKCPACGRENPGYVEYCGFCGGTMPCGGVATKNPPEESRADIPPQRLSETVAEEPRFKRLIVALSVTSMFLLALSMLQPWFTVHDQITYFDQDGAQYPGVWEDDIQFHMKYYTFRLGAPSDYETWQTGEYWSDNPWNDDTIGEAMDFTERSLLLTMTLVWLLSIVAAMNSRWIALILAWSSAAACLLSVALFGGRIGVAVTESGDNLQGLSLYFVSGLFGEETITRDTDYGSELNVWSWQPGWGFYFATIAGIILCVAAALKWSSMLIPREITDIQDGVVTDPDSGSTTKGI